MTFKWFVRKVSPDLSRPMEDGDTRRRRNMRSKYLVDKFKDVPLRNIGLFELRTRLNVWLAY